MKKILLAFDGGHFSENILLFVKKLNGKNPVFLTGAFLPQIDYAGLWSYSGGGLSGTSFIPMVEDADAIEVKVNIKRFENFCRENDIRFSVHKNYFNFALPELRKESRYADLLIISSEKFYEQAGTGSPNEYLTETLRHVECPVLVMPEMADLPQTNILAYDGSASSVYAIKQFVYLFPELCENKTLLVYAAQKENDPVPSDINIRELITQRFPRLHILHLAPDASKDFATWAEEKKAAILITGAFGRSELSMLFRKSFTAGIIGDHRLPVFIAHK